MKFRRQHPIGPYALDFYCPELALCIEVDGEQHDPLRDQQRDQYLEALGIKTIRIPSLALFVTDSDVTTFLRFQIEVRCQELGVERPAFLG